MTENTPTPGFSLSTTDFTTKRLMGAILIIALVGIGIAWVGLSIHGLPGWVNIVLILVAILIIIVTAWLFLSK